MEGCPKALMINYDLKEVGPIDNAFEKPLSDYIQEFYHENPQLYTHEIQQITQLRKGIGNIPHDIQGCNILRKYFTQLHYLQSRFPMGEGGAAAVPFLWYDIYSCDPVVYSDIRYEQACVLFNLGSLYSQLAANEDRLSDESMKTACTFFQNAAGCFQFLKDNFLLSDMADMNDDILGLKITIMLGQALECILEKSIRDNRNATLISRIAIQVKTYFNNGIEHLSKPGAIEMGSSLQKMWKKHLKIKILCYEAIAYIYMGNDAELKEKYGEKVAYLKVSSEKITEASKELKNQPEKTVDTIRFVMDVVGNKYEGAVKDNDFIYHMGVPQTSALAEIEGVNFVKPLPFQYDDESTTDIFHKLVPMKAHEASSLYSEKKDYLIREMSVQIEQKDLQLSQFMSAMKIEDLIDPKEDTLPDELLSRNKFLQDNPDLIAKVERDIEELSNLTAIVESMLKDIQEMVDNEKQLEELDEMELSSEMKAFLTELEQCNNAHKQASKTNSELIKHATESQGMIQFLSGDTKSILSALPSQNVVEAPTDEPVVQRIREILVKVEKMRSQRLHLLKKLRSEVNEDDITSKLVVHDKGNTEAFFEEELKKHSETITYIKQNLSAQDNIIEALTEANAKYATTRQKVQSISKKFDTQVQTYLNVISLFLEVKDRIRSGVEFYKQFENNVKTLQKNVNEYCTMKNKTQKKKVPSRPTAKKPNIIRSNKPNLPTMQPMPMNHPSPAQIPPTQIHADPTRFTSPVPHRMFPGPMDPEKNAFDHNRFPTHAIPNLPNSPVSNMHPRYPASPRQQAPVLPHNVPRNVQPQIPKSYRQDDFVNPFANNIRPPTDPNQFSNIVKDANQPQFRMPGSPHISTVPSGPVSVGVSPVSSIRYPQPQNTIQESKIPYSPRHMMNRPRFPQPQQPTQQPLTNIVAPQFIPQNQQQPFRQNYSPRYPQNVQHPVRFPPQTIPNQRHQFPQQPRIPRPDQQVQPMNIARHPSQQLHMPPSQQPLGQRLPRPITPNQVQFIGRQPMVMQHNQIPPGPHLQNPPHLQNVINTQLPQTLPTNSYPSNPQAGYANIPPHFRNGSLGNVTSMHEPDISQTPNLPPPLIPERSDAIMNDLSPVLPRTNDTPVVQGMNKQVASIAPEGNNILLNSLPCNQNVATNQQQLPNVFAPSFKIQASSGNQFPQSTGYPNSFHLPVNDLILPRPLQQQNISAAVTPTTMSLKNDLMNASLNNAPATPMELRNLPEPNTRQFITMASPSPRHHVPYVDINPVLEGNNSKIHVPISPIPSQTSVGISYASFPSTMPNIRNVQSGVLFASKPMMSPSSDPVVSNILGRNENKTQELAQLGFQQFQLQQTVLQQQQQLMSLLQSQRSMQNLQRTEEDSKIQTLQAQITNQQQVIESLMKEQKEIKQQDNSKRLEEEHRLKEKEQEQAITKLQEMIAHLLKQTSRKSIDQDVSKDVNSFQLKPALSTNTNVHQDKSSEVPIFPPDYPSVTGTVLNSNPHSPTVHSFAISPDIKSDLTASLDEMSCEQPNKEVGKCTGYSFADTDVSKISSIEEVPEVNIGGEGLSKTADEHGFSNQLNQTNLQQKPFYEPTIDAGNVNFVSDTQCKQSIIFPRDDEIVVTRKDDDIKELIQPTDSLDDVTVSPIQEQLTESNEKIATAEKNDDKKIDETNAELSNHSILEQQDIEEVLSADDKITDEPVVVANTMTSKGPDEDEMVKSKDTKTSNSETSITQKLPTADEAKEIVENAIKGELVDKGKDNIEKPSPSSVAYKPVASPPIVSKFMKSTRKISNKSSPNISSRSSPNLSARSSPILGGQVVQLDDMDTKERTLSNLIDHKHLARQLGRMSFYVGEPDEAVWRNYLKELEACADKLREECKNLCKPLGKDYDGFSKIWNDLAEVELLDIRSYTSSEGQANVTKNRYRDILPWDHARVTLKCLPSDYINASLIENLTPLSPRYIATQGPIPQCFEDFWTMVWEQKSSVIVMLTNEVEGHKLKCHPYWCREVDVPAEYGQMVVIMMEEQVLSAWKLRIFTLLNKKEEETRIVRQLQFTSWPDYGTPETPYELLSFTEEVFLLHQMEDPSFAYPLILHCSAGVGRTGSFCCIYSAIREIEGQNNLIEIPGVVRKLRQCRQHMVQRKEQLIFCYQAIICFAQQFIVAERLKLDNRFRQSSQSISSEDSLFASASSMSFQAMKQPYTTDKIFRQKSSRVDKSNISSQFGNTEPFDALVTVNNLPGMPNYPSLGIVPCALPSEQFNRQPSSEEDETKTVVDQTNPQASGTTPKFKINSGIFQIAKNPSSEQAVLTDPSQPENNCE